MHNPYNIAFGNKKSLWDILRIISDQYIIKHVQYEQSQLLIKHTIMIDIDFVSDQYKI